MIPKISVRRIMKLNDEVSQVGQECALAMTIASEQFVKGTRVGYSIK